MGIDAEPALIEASLLPSFIKLDANPAFCLNLDHFSQTNGAKINLWKCNGEKSQRWIYDGSKIMLEANRAFCLNLDHFSQTNGAKINLWKCNGQESQKWNMRTHDQMKLTANPLFCLNLDHAA